MEFLKLASQPGFDMGPESNTLHMEQSPRISCYKRYPSPGSKKTSDFKYSAKINLLKSPLSLANSSKYFYRLG